MMPEMDDYEVVAQELSTLAEKLRELERRVADVEKVNARLEEAALTTARGLSVVSHHWDMVYEAMRRPETPVADKASERDNAAARKRRGQ